MALHGVVEAIPCIHTIVRGDYMLVKCNAREDAKVVEYNGKKYAFCRGKVVDVPSDVRLCSRYRPIRAW